MEKTGNDTANREQTIKKILAAPIELVWNTWADPVHIANWWGPNEFTTTIRKMNFEEGGEWLLTMHGPDGKNYPNKSIFLEIVPHKKIVHQHFNPGYIATIVFEAQGKETSMEWSMLFETTEMFEIVVKTFKADEGLKQSAEKLNEYLQEIKKN